MLACARQQLTICVMYSVQLISFCWRDRTEAHCCNSRADNDNMLSGMQDEQQNKGQSHWAKLRMAHRAAAAFKPPIAPDAAKKVCPKFTVVLFGIH